MATVKMEISELKDLERKIETLEKEKENLLAKQKQVLVLHKYFNASIRVVDKAFNNNNLTITGIARGYTPRMDYWNDGSRMAMLASSLSASSPSFIKEIKIDDALANGIIELVTTEDVSRTSSEYVNLHETVEAITNTIKEQFKVELDIAKNRALLAESKVDEAEEDAKASLIKEQKRLQKKYDEAIEIKEKSYDTALEEVSKNYDKEIAKANNEIKTLKEKYDKLVQEYKEKYDKLVQEYDDYKNDRKRLTLEQQIADLTAKLEAERKKGFWRRVFNY